MISKKIVRFLNLSITESDEREEMIKIFSNCLDHGQLVMGHEIQNLEKKLSNFVDRKRCINVSSGTDAVYLSLKALGIGAGDEVITTPLSWIATANAISMVGAEPVFCDIKDDLNIDSSTIQNLITSRTKAILTVDFTGNMVEYNEINKIAKQYGIKIIEDGSQAFGASYQGVKCGAHGDISAISHNPMKIFGALGEFGSVFTDDDEIAEKLEVLRYNGMINKEYLSIPSLNFRADALHASLLAKRLEYLPKKLERRNTIARMYNEKLSEFCITPSVTSMSKRVFYCYTVIVENREKLVSFLSKNGIETKIQHPLLMSEQSPYKTCRSYTPKASELVKKILSLPIHESLDDDSVNYVISKVREFYS